jgi:hypothetical protein
MVYLNNLKPDCLFCTAVSIISYYISLGRDPRYRITLDSDIGFGMDGDILFTVGAEGFIRN